MSDRDDGGAAFPYTPQPHKCDETPPHLGMSLRDWYAGLAMQALIISRGHENVPPSGWPVNAEKTAWRVADAMIKERSKP